MLKLIYYIYSLVDQVIVKSIVFNVEEVWATLPHQTEQFCYLNSAIARQPDLSEDCTETSVTPSCSPVICRLVKLLRPAALLMNCTFGQDKINQYNRLLMLMIEIRQTSSKEILKEMKWAKSWLELWNYVRNGDLMIFISLGLAWLLDLSSQFWHGNVLMT